MKSNLATAIFVISIMIGIVIGKYIPHNHNPKIYLFNESRFFTMASLGLLSDSKDKDQFDKNISKDEKAQISELMSRLKQTLSSDYKIGIPILIEKKNKQLEIYSNVEIVDVTNDVTKKVLGEKRWEQIGKTFLQ
jgi:hypothetical protein